MSVIRKAADIYKRYGFGGFVNKLQEKLQSPVKDYDRMKERFHPDEAELQAERERQGNFAYRPKISVVVPAYETKEQFLKELLDSMTAQTYTNWELCIADGSKSDNVKEFVEKYSEKEAVKKPEYQICYRKLEKNDGISGNTNEGLKMASGDYIGFMDHDDVLSPDALFAVTEWINRCQDPVRRPELLYSDEDKVSADLGTFSQPHFKPDFNLELLRDNNYICHFTVVSRELLKRTGGLKKEFDGSQDYDFILRAVEQTDRICHVPKVLYHWRMHEESTAGDSASKDYTFDAGENALKAHFKRMGIEAQTEKRIEVGCYHIRYGLAEEPAVRILDYQADMDIGKLNRAIRDADEAYIILKDPRLDVKTDDFIREFLSYCTQSRVGAVGAKTYQQSGKVEQNGLIYNCEGRVFQAFHGLPGSFKGYCRRAVLAQEMSAVSFDFAMLKKEAFIKAGDINQELPPLYREMEFAFRLKQAGYVLIQDPYVEALSGKHMADMTETDEAASRYLRVHHAGRLAKGDPCYNHNFSQTEHTFTL